MSERQVITVPFGDMNGIYIISEDKKVSFTIVPGCSENIFPEKITEDPLVQVSCTGDSSAPGFCAGETRHNSGLTMSMRYVSQDIAEKGNEKTVTTTVKSESGITARHRVIYDSPCRSIRVCTEICNDSEENITIEALSSVNITGITPFTEDEGQDRLFLHRFRSRWSAEGRHEVRSIEELLLEPSWAEFGVRCEKYGTVGSMPVRGFFPFAALEDRLSQVIWAMSLACSSSWQAEVIRYDKNLNISCGLADYEYGHWRKELGAGESFVAPKAYLTVVKGSFETACDRLLDIQRDKLLQHQRVTALPALFNEYCTTWGEPSEDRIRKILKVVNGRDYEYFVIDAGWYADSVKGWQDNMGDWITAGDLFPNGLKPVVQMIESAGMKAGIWFELEVVGKDADAVNDTAHLLTRDGKVIISGTRRFWDMRSEWVNEYLTKKVIDFLNENRFKYIKIDYNDTIGIGCDGAESPGEGLRACIEATKGFFQKIREKVPDIAIEICSSGGHRLEPGFMELADYLSFSDAHEEKEIPVIALDLQNLVLTQKSQIWAVLRNSDSLKRIAYSVCAGMYGVLCISGDVEELSEEQWSLVRAGVSFYKKASPIIVSGITKRFGQFQNSNRHLKGYQASVRYSGDRALFIIHAFDLVPGEVLLIPLEGDYGIEEKYEAADHRIEIRDGRICARFAESFDAAAVLLRCL